MPLPTQALSMPAPFDRALVAETPLALRAAQSRLNQFLQADDESEEDLPFHDAPTVQSAPLSHGALLTLL